MKSKTLIRFIGSCVFLGYSPVAPGTMGAIGACIFWVALKHYFSFPDIWMTPVILFLFVAGKLAADRLEDDWGHDDSRFVLDEAVGMLISLLFIPFQWPFLLAAFALFRFFDIVKPLYIRRMERLDRGLGVMMDDVLAGAYVNLILMCFRYSGMN